MMVQNERWLLPEGIDEVLPPDSLRLERMRRELLDLYHCWGYDLVVPPFIEYLESLLTGTGSDLDLQTFKLTDQVTGRMLGIRADITPQAARIDAHKLRREAPVRLCYIGTILHTRADEFAGSRSPLQIGVELYGHAGIESDVEVLQLMMETLHVAGVTSAYLDLGHVGIFRGLARQANLDDFQERALFAALQRKAVPEVESLLATFGVPPKPARMLAALAELSGDDALARASMVLADADRPVLDALTELAGVARSVERHLPGVPVHFDLSELRGYHYHSGVVFAAFAPGLGKEIALGGRYDNIGKVFGRARPATGFSADLKTLLNVGSASGAPADSGSGISAPWSEDPALVQVIRELRAQGKRVVCGLPGQAGGAKELGCDKELARVAGVWKVVDA